MYYWVSFPGSVGFGPPILMESKRGIKGYSIFILLIDVQVPNTQVPDRILQ